MTFNSGRFTYQLRNFCGVLRNRDINELYVAISKELKQLESAEDVATKTASLRTIQAAMDQYTQQQVRNDLKNLRDFFDRDDIDTINLLELDNYICGSIEIPLQHNTPLKLLFDSVSTVMLAGEVLLEKGLTSPEDID